MPNEPSTAVLKAARAIRIKVHSFGTGKVVDCQHADNAENKKWLDSVSLEDAKTIEEITHYSDLIETLQVFIELFRKQCAPTEDELHAVVEAEQLLNRLKFGTPR